MWKNDSIDGWERKEKSWINVGLNPDVTYTWWIHSFIKWRVMFFFFKLLLKTFNNFLKDKCNVSTIFCYFKTEKLLNSYHSWKNIAIHQDSDKRSYNFLFFNLRVVDHFWKKQISRYIKIIPKWISFDDTRKVGWFLISLFPFSNIVFHIFLEH